MKKLLIFIGILLIYSNGYCWKDRNQVTYDSLKAIAVDSINVLAKKIAQDTARKFTRDSAIVLKNMMDDSAKKVWTDSAMTLRNMMDDSAKKVFIDSLTTVKTLIKDTITAKMSQYQILPLPHFVFDTSRIFRLVGTAKSDTINQFLDCRGDTLILGISTDDSAYSRRQNGVMIGRFPIGFGINSVDTLRVRFRTKQASKDTNSVQFYVGEENIATHAITWRDSLVADTVAVSWTSIKLVPTNITKGDILVMMMRYYCIGLNYIYIDQPYIEQR